MGPDCGWKMELLYVLYQPFLECYIYILGKNVFHICISCRWRVIRLMAEGAAPPPFSVSGFCCTKVVSDRPI